MGNNGCYCFDNGTKQGWNLFQVYGYETDKKYKPLNVNGVQTGYVLSNFFNQALNAETENGVLLQTRRGEKIDFYYIMLISPDLMAKEEWQGLSGITVDVYRDITTALGIDGMYHVELAVMPGTGTTLEAQKSKRGKLIKHTVFYNKNTSLQWDFNDELIDRLAQNALKRVVVKLVTPYVTTGQAEITLAKGQWMISNVCPVK